MKLPTEEQIDRAAKLLAQLRENGNRRPGDNHIDHDIEVQLRARATDMLVIMLNEGDIFYGG
jgi:hypothetical protein